MMRTRIARWLVVVLLFALIPPVYVQEEAHAADPRPYQGDVSIRPEADKFVDDSGAYPNGEADGGDQSNQNAIYIGYQPGFGAMKGALRFPLNTIDSDKEIQSVVLSMYIRNKHNSIVEPILNLYGSDENLWTESDMNLPDENSTPITHGIQQFRIGERVGIDVTDFVKPRVTAGQQQVSFRLEGYASQDSFIIITDRFIDDPLYNTYLEVTYEPNQPPTNLTLSGNTIPENSPFGTEIGTFSADDPDDSPDTLSYSLSGEDASRFRIEGNRLLSDYVFDFESKNRFNITVQVEDSAQNSTTENFEIHVTDVNEPPSSANFQINEDATYTNHEAVSLSTTILDPDTNEVLRFQFSNEQGVWDGNWQPYSATPTVTS